MEYIILVFISCRSSISEEQFLFSELPLLSCLTTPGPLPLVLIQFLAPKTLNFLTPYDAPRQAP